ncbi:MAG: hypothetical protein QMD22_10025, partial [archaeon]|nr:hypothetical protein [archaeon]
TVLLPFFIASILCRVGILRGILNLQSIFHTGEVFFFNQVAYNFTIGKGKYLHHLLVKSRGFLH